jgi:ATP-dependent helicase/nuclease subunit A
LLRYTKQDDKELLDWVVKLNKSLDLIIDLDSFVDAYEFKYYSQEQLNKIIDDYNKYTKEEVNKIIFELEELERVSAYDSDSIKLNTLVNTMIAELKSLSSYEEYYLYFSTHSLPVVRKGSETVKELKKQVAESIKKLKETVFDRYVFESDMIDEIISVKDDTIYLLKMCIEVKNRLFQYKLSINSFDYIDIAKMAIKLVKTDEEVNKSLKYFFKEILIDECQDTSDIQEEFINAIANNNVYMVGDIKQSIYRFRNANPSIFKEKYDNYANCNGGIKIDLLYNFRSREEVLADINLLFNQLMTEECGDADYIKSHQMNYGLVKYDEYKEYNFNSSVLTYSKEGFEEYSNEEIEAFICANSIKNIMDSNLCVFKKGSFNKIAYSDFAVLIDKAKSFITFKQIFEYLNIPLSIEADLDLKDSILPKLFSNILTLIYKIKNSIKDTEYRHALASISRSFIYEYNDEDIYLMLNKYQYMPILSDFKFLANLDEISYSKLFYEICFKLNIYDKLSLIGDVENSLVVLEYIHNIFKSLTDSRMKLEDACLYLSDVFSSDISLKYKLKGDSSKSVRIMTIHKSKGLEFPVCYFPLLSSGFNKSEIRSEIGYDKEYGIYIPFVEDGKSDTVIKKLVSNSILKKDISEKVRLLYVGLTRAREKMILISSDNYKDVSNNKFSSFNEMIRTKSVLAKYYEPINLADINISSLYKDKTNSETINGNIKLSYDNLVIPKQEIKSSHASKEIHQIIDEKMDYILNRGIRLHSILESIDFTNPNLDEIEIDENERIIIENVLSNDIFKNIKYGKSFHEHEFYFIKDDVEYHGIIDLFVIYDDHIDIIDYKLSNVDSEEYITQLNIYKEYIKTKYDKQINVYLLSLLKNEIKKLD